MSSPIGSWGVILVDLWSARYCWFSCFTRLESIESSRSGSHSSFEEISIFDLVEFFSWVFCFSKFLSLIGVLRLFFFGESGEEIGSSSSSFEYPPNSLIRVGIEFGSRGGSWLVLFSPIPRYEEVMGRDVCDSASDSIIFEVFGSSSF